MGGGGYDTDIQVSGSRMTSGPLPIGGAGAPPFLRRGEGNINYI